MTNIQLGRRNIDFTCRPYIIAEIGVNHEGSFDMAKKLIDLAKEGGADAAKFQSYKADNLASKNSPAYWDIKKELTLSQFELFKKYDNFNEEQYISLSAYCDSVGIDFLSTPFDDESIEFLEPLMPFYKIASADLTNTPFVRKIARKNKPIVLSTGASSMTEISKAIDIIEEEGCNNISLLHCVLNYPTIDRNAHLSMISGLKKAYPDFIVGYSDHTLPNENMIPLVTAYLLGAQIIEKHFTNDKSLPGNDHYHSMDVNDLKNFVSILNQIEKLKGSKNNKEPISTESVARLNARRSIVLSSDVLAGDFLSEENMTYKRPGNGISPLYWDELIGCRVSSNLKSDHILQWTDIKKGISEK